MNNASKQSLVDQALSLKQSALIAGFGLLIMVFCAPLGHFYFMSQSVVAGKPAATVQLMQANGTPYVVGMMMLFLVYLMDVVVAWALYWFLRSGQPALSQLVAWNRLVYTGLAFTGLCTNLTVYNLATSAGDYLNEAELASAVFVQLAQAKSMESLALAFFGVHLWLLSLLLWRSAHVPRWLSIPVALAGFSYVLSFLAHYFSLEANLDMLLILAMGEIVLMVWLLTVGWRKQLEDVSAT